MTSKQIKLGAYLAVILIVDDDKVYSNPKDTKCFVKWFTLDPTQGMEEITEWPAKNIVLEQLLDKVREYCTMNDYTLWSY